VWFAGGCVAAWLVLASPTAGASPTRANPEPEPTAKGSTPDGAQRDIRLLPLFTKPVPMLKNDMERTIGEALSMPSPALSLRQQVAPARTARQREDTATWVRRLLKPEWVDEAALDRWLALRAAVQGNDALFGGWPSHGRTVQIVATAKRLHVRVPLPAQSQGASGLALIQQATALARQLFNTDADWDKFPWQTRELGGFTVGYFDIPLVRDWWESCLIVSDGSAVKFSFLKIPHRDSPPAGHLAPQKRRPWFSAPSERKQ
jgi:hypothetical protein